MDHYLLLIIRSSDSSVLIWQPHRKISLFLRISVNVCVRIFPWNPNFLEILIKSEPVGLETQLTFFKWSLWVAGTREKNVSLTSRPYNVKQNIVIIHGLRNHSFSRIILVRHSFYVRVRDCRYCHLWVNQNHIWIYQVK